MAESSSLAAVVEALRRHPRLGPQIVHTARLPEQPVSWGDPDPPLPPALAGALAARGVDRLWSHQADGLAALRAGADVLVTTPTASGKSLVFQLPVLEEAVRGGPGRALFLYPLKALGQDQRSKLEELAAAAGVECRCAIYDGDTPPSRRARLRRDPPRVLITNPDMLHLGILPSWGSWQPFLADLSWIVLDELHTYRGIFGSHFHHVLQRLLRLARLHGAEPRIVASSATAANADEFAHALTGRRFHRIAASGAPREAAGCCSCSPRPAPTRPRCSCSSSCCARGSRRSSSPRRGGSPSCSTAGCARTSRSWRGAWRATAPGSCPRSGGASRRASSPARFRG